MPEWILPASTLHVKRPRPASVRIATCPERHVILGLSVSDPIHGADTSLSVELTTQEARDLVIQLTETLCMVEGRSKPPRTAFERLLSSEDEG